MTNRKKHAAPNHDTAQGNRREKAAHPSPLDGETPPDGHATMDDIPAQMIERPDGFYWQDKPAGKIYGPFPTLLKAMEDMQYQEDSNYEEGETLHEAEAEIGITDWIDPETGAPTQGLTPHLSDE